MSDSSETLSDASEYSDDGDFSEDEDYHPNTQEEEEGFDEDLAHHGELMGDLRKALEHLKAHFEKCQTPKAHLYLAMIDQGADALDAYWKDVPEYGF